MLKLFITIEGPDGAGKSTLAKALQESLAARHKALLTRAPGGGEFAEKLRPMIKGGAAKSLLQELSLLQAAWVGCLEEQVLAGDEKIVIFDRVPYASSFFYQGLFYRQIPQVKLFWSNLSSFIVGGADMSLAALASIVPVFRIFVGANDKVLEQRTLGRGGADHFESRMLAIREACHRLTGVLQGATAPEGYNIFNAYWFLTKDVQFFRNEPCNYDLVVDTSADDFFDSEETHALKSQVERLTSEICARVPA